ncbi:MAG: NFACT family protein [Candidatus Woesearchaeota archaeon]
MKELSYIEIKKVVEELQFLKGGKIEQIYMPGRKEIFLKLYLKDSPKLNLRILVPNFLYLTSYKPNTDFPPGFCTFLRKKIQRARIKDIYQKGNERIIVMTIEAKDSTFDLIMEFFLKGNVMLCENNKILSPLENQNWKERTIRGGVEYSVPEKELSELKEDLDKPLVKFLATEMNLGGTIAEEVCLRTGIDKSSKKLSEENIKRLNSEIDALKEEKPKGFSYYRKNSDKKDLVDVMPFEMQKYNEHEKIEHESFNKALDSSLTEARIEKVKEANKKTIGTKSRKFENIIKAQEKQFEKLEKKIEESSKKGELIYNNYNSVKEILGELHKANKKYSWKEIKEKLKDHKIIKNIDEKTGKVTLDLK